MTYQECCLLNQVGFGIQGTFVCVHDLDRSFFQQETNNGYFYDMPLVSGFFLQLLSDLFSSVLLELGETEEPACYLRNHYQVSQ